MAHNHNINKELQAKLALKRKGHSLVDKIKWKGYSKDEVYSMLAREMGLDEEHAHFARMQSMRTLTAAVIALEKILARVPATQYASNKTERPKAEEPLVIVKRAEPTQTIVLRVQPETFKVKKVGARLAQKKANTLPREVMLQVLAEMKAEKEKGFIITQVGNEPPVVQTYNRSELVLLTRWQKLLNLFQRNASSLRKSFGPRMVSPDPQSPAMKV